MLAVVALGLVGAAYALWFENLSLTANVSTGNLQADMSVHQIGPGTSWGNPVVGINPTVPASLSGGLATYFDTGDAGRHFDNGAAGYANFTNGNFGLNPQPSCGAALTNDGTLGGDTTRTNNNSLTLNMSGLYPYAGCEYQIDITNSGTVPIRFGVTHLQYFTCTGVGTGCTAADGGNAPWSVGLDPSMSPTNLAQCAAWLGNTFGKIVTGSNTLVHGFNGGPGWIGGIPIKTAVTSPDPNGPSLSNDTATVPVQLNPTQSIVCNFKLILDEQPGAENQNFQFKATYEAYQWNESPF